MTKIETIKMLIKVENIMGIYRNYTFFGKRWKTIIMFRFVFEIIFLIPLAIVNTKFILKIYEYNPNMPEHIIPFYVIQYLGDLLTIISGIQNTNRYKIFITNLMGTHKLYSKELNYRKSLRQLKFIFIIGFTIFVIVRITFGTLETLDCVYQTGLDSKSTILLEVTEMWVDIRYILEYFVLFTFVMVLYNLTMCYNATISMKFKHANNMFMYLKQRRSGYFHLSKEEIKQWATKYGHLVNCSQQLSSCFENQITFSLAMSALRYICVIYIIICIIIQRAHNFYMYAVRSLYGLVFELLLTYMVTYSGQKLSNENVKLNRLLSSLYCLLTSELESPEAKLVRDFKIMTNTKLISIKAGKIGLGMYLIPAILTWTVSNVIVGLQLTHII